MAYTKKKKPAPKPKSANQSVALPQHDVVQDDELATLIRYVNESDDATIDSRALSERARDYYDSKQITAEEQAVLRKRKQPIVVVNRVKPKIDGLMGMERANRTTAKAQPRTPKHTQAATAATEAVRYCLQDNMYERVRSDAWDNLLNEGTGGIEIIAAPGEGDTFDIRIRHIMWDRLIYDPHGRRKDFSDAKYLGQVVWMDYDDAAAMYPNAVDVLETMQSGSETYDDKPRWMDNTRRRVKIVELYYKRPDGDWWYACFTRGGYCEAPKKSPYVNEIGETEHAYEFASLFVDRDGNRYGASVQFLDIQDEINKRRSKALHLLSVRQTFGTAGAVADVNKARAELAKPDGHVEFAYGELNKDFGILPTGDMVAGQFNLLGEAKMEIDSVGANAATMGKDKTVQSGVALRQRALTGQTELAPMFDVLKNLDLRVYRKVWNRIKQYWKAEMWIRVTDDENNLKFVGLNKPMTKGETLLKQAQEQGAPPQALQQLQQQIAVDPTMAEVVSTENDIAHLDVDIIMDDAPDTVTQEVEDFQAMAEMVKSGFPIPPEAVIMASPLSNKDKVIKMMKESPQIPPKVQEQIEQMQAEFEKLKAEHQKMAQENQALKQDQQAEMAKLQLQGQSEQAKMQMQAQMDQQKLAAEQARAQADLQLKAQTQAAELQLERERAAAQIELERMKAEAQMQLQGMKMQGDQQAQKAKLEFDQQCRAEDTAHDAKETAMPKIEKALSTGLQAGFSQMADMLAQILDVLKNPPARQVSISGIQKQRDASGELTGVGATVKPTLQ